VGQLKERIGSYVLRPKIWTQNSRFLVNHLPYALLG
jgi:hypothetical protein